MNRPKMIGSNIRSTPGGFIASARRKDSTQTVVMAAAQRFLSKRGLAGHASAFERTQANTKNP